jgi:hypothetical protein
MERRTTDSALPESPVFGNTLKPLPANGIHGGQVGDNWPPEIEHEPRQVGLADPNPDGDGESSSANHVARTDGASAPLKFLDVIERFHSNTRLRFKAGGSTSSYYTRAFKRLWTLADFEGKTRRQIAGKRSRDAILRFMETVPLRSRRTILAALECVWVEGLEAPWPINRRRDFGKTLPSIGRRETPPDDDVRPWAEAVWKEPDPFVRLLVMLLLQFGWRPENQIGHLRWRNVRYDGQGRPIAIIAKGDVEGFKTRSDVVANLPGDLVDALQVWKKICDNVSPDAFILARAPRGSDTASQVNEERIRYLLGGFERRWGLKHLPPALFRHWVKTTCRRLSDPALAALQGHAPPKDGSMRNVYDTPSIERILDEQATEFPHGALGVFRPAVVSVAPDYQAELEAVIEWKEGRMNLLELVGRLETLQRKQPEPWP